jgi:serine/threonine protein kinase
MHALDRCLRHPPLGGSDGIITVDLEIVGAVRVGDNQSAQLVSVRVKRSDTCINSLPSDTNIVAKIYDPLYFDHEQDDADPFLCVGRDYSNEAAVYTALAQLQGTVIPKYFGSYTLNWPVNGASDTRSVRLILIEQVPGTSMQQLDPRDFSQPVRQRIMKEVIDAETLLYTHDIIHGDRHPRNILVLTPLTASRIRIIDFGKSKLGRTPYPGEKQRYLPGVPISPLLRWNQT